jgi:hypothetical protein
MPLVQVREVRNVRNDVKRTNQKSEAHQRKTDTSSTADICLKEIL